MIGPICSWYVYPLGERAGFEVEVLDIMPGEEAGTVQRRSIAGPHALPQSRTQVFTASCVSVPLIPMPVAIPSLQSMLSRKLRTMLILKSMKLTSAQMSTARWEGRTTRQSNGVSGTPHPPANKHCGDLSKRAFQIKIKQRRCAPSQLLRKWKMRNAANKRNFTVRR